MRIMVGTGYEAGAHTIGETVTGASKTQTTMGSVTLEEILTVKYFAAAVKLGSEVNWSNDRPGSLGPVPSSVLSRFPFDLNSLSKSPR